ncbi:MAG: hypothetical protein JSW47_12910 [Phycisphaerales bacterium]|nr:MAG: hypothetical protein JSW47_12910 [Phycisphaerales bacterium]
MRVFKGKIDDDFLNLLPDRIGFVEKMQIKDTVDLTKESLSDLQVRVCHKADLKRMDKFWFINKIRNGIAHQNVESLNCERKWVGVRLSNKPAKNTKDFEIIFTIEQLRGFALELSQLYLEQTGQLRREEEQLEFGLSDGTTELSDLDR